MFSHLFSSANFLLGIGVVFLPLHFLTDHLNYIWIIQLLVSIEKEIKKLYFSEEKIKKNERNNK